MSGYAVGALSISMDRFFRNEPFPQAQVQMSSISDET